MKPKVLVIGGGTTFAEMGHFKIESFPQFVNLIKSLK